MITVISKIYSPRFVYRLLITLTEVKPWLCLIHLKKSEGALSIPLWICGLIAHTIVDLWSDCHHHSGSGLISSRAIAEVWGYLGTCGLISLNILHSRSVFWFPSTGRICVLITFAKVRDWPYIRNLSPGEFSDFSFKCGRARGINGMSLRSN